MINAPFLLQRLTKHPWYSFQAKLTRSIQCNVHFAESEFVPLLLFIQTSNTNLPFLLSRHAISPSIHTSPFTNEETETLLKNIVDQS